MFSFEHLRVHLNYTNKIVLENIEMKIIFITLEHPYTKKVTLYCIIILHKIHLHILVHSTKFFLSKIPFTNLMKTKMKLIDI